MPSFRSLSSYPFVALLKPSGVPKKTDRLRSRDDLVGDVLTRWCVGAVVTTEDDRRLDQAGLRQKMPADRDQRDPFARYRAVGIVLREHRAPVVD